MLKYGFLAYLKKFDMKSQDCNQIYQHIQLTVGKKL